MPDYHIYTIPLWDAYKKGGECPLCHVQRMLESQYLDSALGGSVMEPDTRQAVNKEGFCPKHLRRLYEMQNMLPVALMLHTHYKDVLSDMDSALSALEASVAQEEGGSGAMKAIRGLKRGGGTIEQQADALANLVQSRSETCHICRKVDQNMERYVETLLYMYKTESEFPKAFADSKGFCLHHFPLVAKAAGSKLAGNTRREFIKTLVNIQRQAGEAMEKDLEWFTLKFDYRNADKPWGTAKDAVPRGMERLRGPVLPTQENKN